MSNPIRPKEKEGSSEERNRQLQDLGQMVKQAARGRIKKNSKGKRKGPRC